MRATMPTAPMTPAWAGLSVTARARRGIANPATAVVSSLAVSETSQAR